MTVFHLITLLGGLGLFLYGMNTMGNGLEKLAGGRAESILQRMTSNPIKGVGLGAVITALVQSSSATTVIVIGLVNSGIMKFAQAIGVVMGANIGTTVTGQILRLSDISGDNILLQLLKPTVLAPAAAFIGILLFMFFKSAKNRNIGTILLGFGVLFTGMFSMEAAVVPLQESPVMQELFAGLNNPLLGVLIGAGVTAVIQSSSASIGILQALTVTGVVTWGSAIPIILGQNIGTTVTGLIASAGATRAARRVAVSHVYFNVIGTAVFMAAIYGIKALLGGFDFWDDPIGKGDVANFHTIFNIVAVLLFLPFTKLLVKVTELTVPEKGDVHPELEAVILDQRLYASPQVALAQARKAVEQMAEVGRLVQASTVDNLLKLNREEISLAHQRENVIDKLDVSVSNYLVGLNERDLTEAESREVTTLLTFVTEFERIGDYAINVVEHGEEVDEKGIKFSDTAKRELRVISDAVDEVIDLTINAFVHDDIEMARKVEPLEETVDAICEMLRERHITRLKEGNCVIDAGIVFLEVLTDYERISDHCSNVAARMMSAEVDSDPHKLRRSLHAGEDLRYNELVDHFQEKYFKRLERSAEEAQLPGQISLIGNGSASESLEG